MRITIKVEDSETDEVIEESSVEGFEAAEEMLGKMERRNKQND